jgi:aminopeptidase N
MMRDAERPNYELYALAEGFWQPDQLAITEGYVERFFDEIAATAKLRSGWVVEILARRAYPWPVIDATTVAATERLLADEQLDSRIRRSVVDAGDDLRRALAARTRYRLAPDVA